MVSCPCRADTNVSSLAWLHSVIEDAQTIKLERRLRG